MTTPPSQITTPEVFIVESLDMKNERAGCHDGKLLFDTLVLYGRKPQYYYFRTTRELRELSKIFRDSGYRYLHLSCHGSTSNLEFTFGSVTFVEFAQTFEDKLEHRRMFISGCELGNIDFASALFDKNGGMYSLTGPTKKVFFDQALTFWNSFYYLMDSIDPMYMKKDAIDSVLNKICPLFEIEIGHFYKSTAHSGTLIKQTF